MCIRDSSQPVCVPDVVLRVEPRLRRGARDGAARDHARRVLRDVPRANEAMSASNLVSARRLRTALLVAVAALLLAVWAFPVIWALLTSFKTERDVLAYPPTVIFEPTLANYRDVMFGSASLLPNLLSSTIVAGASTSVSYTHLRA